MASRDVSIRFIEQRVRGQNNVECCIEVTETANNNYDNVVVYPMGATWLAAKQDYPTLSDILHTIGMLDEFIDTSPDEFNITAITGDEGLYVRNLMREA